VASKAVISLTTGLEDPEKVTVAFLMAVAAAEQGRPAIVFCAKEAAGSPWPARPKAPPAMGARRCQIWRSAMSPRAAGTWSFRPASTPRTWTTRNW
jgi:hypothetical protein